MAKASLQTIITRLRGAFLATNPAGEEGKLSRELDALPLATAEELWFFMHPDGRLLAFNLFVDEVTAEFTEERDVAFGLRLGSDRYPELEELLPERVNGAVECKGCLIAASNRPFFINNFRAKRIEPAFSGKQHRR